MENPLSVPDDLAVLPHKAYIANRGDVARGMPFTAMMSAETSGVPGSSRAAPRRDASRGHAAVVAADSIEKIQESDTRISSRGVGYPCR